MNVNQHPTGLKFSRADRRTRIIAAFITASIMMVFFLLWAGGHGWYDSTYLFGICGFQQRYGLPCPTCFWRRAGQAFISGDILRSFYIQPAAALMYSLLLIIAFFALLTFLFGIHFRLPERFRQRKYLWFTIAGVVLVILAAWILTLIRAFRGIEVV
jgi:magnesium-transporting ATPase (P-type)